LPQAQVSPVVLAHVTSRPLGEEDHAADLTVTRPLKRRAQFAVQDRMRAGQEGHERGTVKRAGREVLQRKQNTVKSFPKALPAPNEAIAEKWPDAGRILRDLGAGETVSRLAQDAPEAKQSDRVGVAVLIDRI
jgi:hypothetical protein